MTQLLHKYEEPKPARTSFVSQWGIIHGLYRSSHDPLISGPFNKDEKRIDAVKIIHNGLSSWVTTIDIRIDGKWQITNQSSDYVLELQEEEYICYTKIRYQNSWIWSVHFKTNYGNELRYHYNQSNDTENEEPLTLSNHAMLTDMKFYTERNGAEMKWIQFYWTAAPQMKYTPKWLSSMGNSNPTGNDLTYYKEMGIWKHKITAIRLLGATSGNGVIKSIGLQINHNTWIWYGDNSNFGTSRGVFFVLDDEEYLNSCTTITDDKNEIIYCKFGTNKKREVEIGNPQSTIEPIIQSGLLMDCRAVTTKPSTVEYIIQLQLMWIDGEESSPQSYEIITIEFDIDAGDIIEGGIPAVIAIQTLVNESCETQTMQFEYSKEVTEIISMNHEAGLAITAGTTISKELGIPTIGKVGVEIELSATAHYTFTYGTENSTSQTFTGTFPVSCPPQSTVICNAVVISSVIEVPYKVILENGIGNRQISYGTWRAVSAWNVQSVIEQPKKMARYPLSKL